MKRYLKRVLLSAGQEDPWQSKGVRIRPAFELTAPILLFGVCLLIIGTVISIFAELGDVRWVLLGAFGIVTLAWIFSRSVIRRVLLMNAANTQRGTGIAVARLGPRLIKLRENYLAPLELRHGRQGHSPARLATARVAVSSRSFFGSRTVVHEEIQEHCFEV
jgi:hypothetical protein